MSLPISGEKLSWTIMCAQTGKDIVGYHEEFEPAQINDS